MTLTLKNTQHMTTEEMEPHWPEIIACITKYCDKFPDEETVEHALGQCFRGERQLWLILDEESKVVLTPITEIITLASNGKKILMYAQAGGSRIEDALPLMSEIEEWAKQEHGVTQAHWWGRKGYRKLLGDYGFNESIVVFKKDI
ncbi:hypothetical protein [Phyllobacterium sophorae]|uniref:GNAT family N-acetyltransferase n=1 Tax=Phyllobacterium sophorae TaxID=1520277 RepID=A0A2P7BDV2_9HYPH|nr:hypothetical protein [Phyllobacterium sophorae]PSH64657.1 hypothetical protein CU103_12300 [Phyllobacterium sophorae]